MKPGVFDGRLRLWVPLIVGLVTGIEFWPVVAYRFLFWDDNVQVTENPHIRALNHSTLTWMFTDTSWGLRYTPLSWVNWALIYRWVGLDARYYHLEDLAFHVANAVLCYFVISFLVGLARPDVGDGIRTISSGLAALLWSIHPLRVENVAWITQERYSQSVCLCLISVLFYLRAVTTKPVGREAYWASVVALALSSLSYVISAGIVVVFLVLDVYPIGRLRSPARRWLRDPGVESILVEKIPFLVVPLLVSYMNLYGRFYASGSWLGIAPLSAFGLVPRAFQACYMWARFLWLPLYPVGLSPVYTTLLEFDPRDPPFVLSALLVVGLTALALVLRTRMRAFLAAWLCYLVLMVPVLGLSEHPHYPSDRYSYLSSIVWSVLLGGALASLSTRSLKAAAALLVAALVPVLGVMTRKQLRTWEDNESLFKHVLAGLEPNDPYRYDIFYRLGCTYMQESDYRSAITALTQAAGPYRSVSLPLKGKAQLALGDLHGATVTAAVLAASPRLNGSRSRSLMGAIREREGRLEEARGEFESAVALNPRDLEARVDLAGSLARLGKRSEAIAELKVALQIQDDYPDARTLLTILEEPPASSPRGEP